MVRVGPGNPPLEHRFKPGNQVRKGWRKPAEEPVPEVELPTAQDLALPHVDKAINVLVALLGHKSWQARRGAAGDLIKIAFPDADKAKVEKMVDEKLQALLAEATAAREAQDAAKAEADRAADQRGIEVAPVAPVPPKTGGPP